MKFYTDKVSNELLKVLVGKGFPAQYIPVGYNTFKEGGGYPEFGTVIPTYAEVLDWLKENDFHISIIDHKSMEENIITVEHNKGEIGEASFLQKSFKELLEKAIIFALDFIELPDISDYSYSASTEE